MRRCGRGLGRLSLRFATHMLARKAVGHLNKVRSNAGVRAANAATTHGRQCCRSRCLCIRRTRLGMSLTSPRRLSSYRRRVVQLDASITSSCRRGS